MGGRERDFRPWFFFGRAIFRHDLFSHPDPTRALLRPPLSLSTSLSFSVALETTQYGATVLAIELLGATTVLLYGVNLLLLPAAPSTAAETDEASGLPRVACAYHVRVLVPCYKESLDILRRTVVAARDAPLPLGCAGKTVYLCDDGRDPKKRKWVDALGDPSVVYVSGRQRPAGEMNGAFGSVFFFLERERERETGDAEERGNKAKKKKQRKNVLSLFSSQPLPYQPCCLFYKFLFSFSSQASPATSTTSRGSSTGTPGDACPGTSSSASSMPTR